MFSLIETRQGSKNKKNNNNNNGGSETENLALEAVKRFGVTEQFCSCSSGCVEDATVALPNARLVSGCKMAYFYLLFNIFLTIGVFFNRAKIYHVKLVFSLVS